MNTPDGIIVALTRVEAMALAWGNSKDAAYARAIKKIETALAGPDRVA